MSGSEGVRPPTQGHDNLESSELRALDREALEAQFQQLMASLDAARDASDAQRCLMLALRTHKAELEVQSRALRDAQDALRVSRDHYARLFDEAPVGYVVLNRRGLIRGTNLTAAVLLGQSKAQLEGRQFLSFIDAEQRRAFVEHLRKVFDASQSPPLACDLVLHMRDPVPIRVARLCSIRRDSVAGPECLSVMLDMTAEHDSEHQRLAGDRLRQSVLNALPSQIAVLDQDGQLLTTNRAWQGFANRQGVCDSLRQALGLNPEGACTWQGDQPSDEVLSAARGIRDVIQRKRLAFSLEHPCETPEGLRWFLMRVLPLEGDQDGAVVSYTDITERRLAEEEARRARDALAQVARLNAVGILASSLIHELVQPLSSAGFYCSAATQLAQGPAADPDRLVEVIRRIDDQVHRAGDIMERLRAFLRGRKMYKVSVSLDQVLKRALELTLWFASDRKVELRLNAPEGLPLIETDPVQIEQVLVNLICNGIQAIDAANCARRKVVLDVIVGKRDIELVVRDTGPGLPEGRHEAVFDIFESTNDSSLGLGLAISRAIAEGHGGRLWAEPAPAEGAVFHLMLPITLHDDLMDFDSSALL
ncbi:PAS domain S-box protein [Thiorhodococcus mannitoliphagus]|uniref:histidine kinase n=1 Tax=Thiorhodococcus mannitoliphagus TaxID=329406 RepID=A0A6P1E0Z1_9GAMM|nr:ATP-binding protein [Thiorhodococcus mannitoliphagus]NEX21654.1 PAS domain S-box protein [Thiorhodococcus mannitoliphagus]